MNATHLNLIPALVNEYGVTAHGDTFTIDYGRINGYADDTDALITEYREACKTLIRTRSFPTMGVRAANITRRNRVFEIARILRERGISTDRM